MRVSPEEEIVRAVCSDKWDGKRLSPSLFAGENTSVSRLSIISLEDHWDVFAKYVQKPPERWLQRIAQINVGRLAHVGLSHTPPTDITVEPEPESWNPAHAEIPQRITRGLANRILTELQLHTPPADFNPGEHG